MFIAPHSGRGSRFQKTMYASLAMATLAGMLLVGRECAAQRSKLKLPDPTVVTLQTKDGVILECTYYAGGFIYNQKDKKLTEVDGKDVVPIIMLHGWEGQGSEYDGLAHYLQMLGHAVLVPDLRGHGKSTGHKFSDRPIEMKRPDYAMSRDIDAAKKYFMDLNNEGKVNIELLTLVGADVGAILAVNWAAQDWSWPQLPSIKQGRDVKALVLLSPRDQSMGVTLNKALPHPAIMRGLAVFIAVGRRDGESYRDAKKIYSRLERARSNLEEAKEGLKILELDTSLSGTKLIAARGIGPQVSYEIAAFVYRRIAAKRGEFKWTERKSIVASE
jgi:pimeloyl-ACP methyl ester carboxylesterase